MDEQSYNDVFDRTGREGLRGKLWATGNPKHKGHWVDKRFFEDYDKNGEQNVLGCAAWCCYLTDRRR